MTDDPNLPPQLADDEAALADYAFGLADRYLAGLSCKDNRVLGDIMAELARDEHGICLKTFMALALRCLDALDAVERNRVDPGAN